MVQPMFDGKVPHWNPQICFFGKLARTVADQEKIKAKVESGGGGGSVNVKAGKKGAAGSMLDFLAEYAKSGRAVCRGCEKKILKMLDGIVDIDFWSIGAFRDQLTSLSSQ